MKIFRFVKKVFFVGLTNLLCFTNANSLSCISINNQECKTKPQVINVNGDEPVLFPFSIETSKCSGSCNNINYPYAKICVSDIMKNLNVKVFNLMTRTKETMYIEWHQTCKLGLMFEIINNFEKKNECRCERTRTLLIQGVRDKGFIWNLSNSECECDKARDVGEYLD